MLQPILPLSILSEISDAGYRDKVVGFVKRTQKISQIYMVWMLGPRRAGRDRGDPQSWRPIRLYQHAQRRGGTRRYLQRGLQL